MLQHTLGKQSSRVQPLSLSLSFIVPEVGDAKLEATDAARGSRHAEGCTEGCVHQQELSSDHSVKTGRTTGKKNTV